MEVAGYNYASRRAKLARLSRYLSPIIFMILNLAVVAILAIALFAWPAHHGWGVAALGADVVVLCISVWLRYGVESQTVDPKSWSARSIQLDQVLSVGVMAGLPANPTPHDIWTSALADWSGRFMANHLLLPVDEIASQLGSSQLDADAIWTKALQLQQQLGDSYLHGALLLAAILTTEQGLQPVLKSQKISGADISSCLRWASGLGQQIEAASHPRAIGGVGRDWAAGYTPTLNSFGINISRQVEGGHAPYVPASHHAAIEAALSHLESGNRISVALLGGVGSGKTSLVYALADRIIHAEEAGQLAYSQVVALNASVLLASGGRLEDTLLTICAEAIHAGNVILFLDEAQLFFGSGAGAVDISQILMPIIQNGSLRLIMAMVPQDWQRLGATSPGLASLITPVTLAEPTRDEVIQVLQESAIGIESRSRQLVTFSSLEEAYRLAARYLPDESLPGKAVKLVQDASHYPEFGNAITAVSVQRAVEGLTGAKVATANQEEGAQLLDLEDQIHQRMVNQTQAVSVVANALRRARSGVANPNRPVGSFLFLGPTGVGKTELAKALAQVYFGGVSHMVRLDMSEYQQVADVSRLLADQPGANSGATLVSAVRKDPSSLVLLDEIEKAHPDVLNLLLQILDEGALTDSAGRKVSFKDAIIIATSNAAADDIRKRVEAGEEIHKVQSAIIDQIIDSHQFRQELLNRFDEIVVFRPLQKTELLQVVDLILAEVNGTLQQQGIQVTLTDAAKQELVERGYDPRFGARPMRRVVQRQVQDVLAKRILAGEAHSGSVVSLDVADLPKE